MHNIRALDFGLLADAKGAYGRSVTLIVEKPCTNTNYFMDSVV